MEKNTTLNFNRYLTGKAFSITAEELTQCAYFDLRVTRDGKHPKDVAKMILKHRADKIEYDNLRVEIKQIKRMSVWQFLKFKKQ